MGRTSVGRFLFVIGVVASASLAQAQVLYEQTFLHPGMGAGDLPLTTYGWTTAAPGGYSGSYSGDFDPMGLRWVATNDPINGNSAAYVGTGGPVDDLLVMIFTTEGAANNGGFDNSIDPSQCLQCYLTTFVQPGPNGADEDFSYFAVRVRDGADERAESFWYIATDPMETPTATGALFNYRVLDFHTASWDDLTVDETGATNPTRGATVGVLPAGLVINGVGLVSSLTNPAPNMDFSNPEAFGGFNYADYRILCVPEPTSVALAVFAMGVLFCMRRKVS